MISGANDVIITGWNDQKTLTLESLDISLSIYAPKIWRELKHYLGVTKKSGYARNSSEGASSDSCETCAHTYFLEAQNTIYLWQGHHHFVLIPPPGNRERPLPLSRVSGTNMVPPLSLSWVPAHSTEIAYRPVFLCFGHVFVYSEFRTESADGDFEVVLLMFWMILQFKVWPSEHRHCPNIG